MTRAALLAGALAATLLGGCASAYVRAETALHRGQHAEAIRAYEEALGDRPERLDALRGLGIARFKTGEYDRAADALARVVDRMPASAEARLYLGLAHLVRRRDDEARAQLVEVRALGPHPRVAAQIERALALLQPDLSAPLRAFIAASLDDAVEWAWDVVEARRIPRAPLEPRWQLYWDGHYAYPLRLYP